LVWIQKPARVGLSIKAHPLKFSGVRSKVKLAKILESLIINEIDALILTKPESICWLLNIRGNDIAHTPIVQCLAIVKQNSRLQLFIRDTKIPKNILSLIGEEIEIIDECLFASYVSTFESQRVQVDPTTCPMAIFSTLESNSNTVIENNDPCVLPKAIKNKTERKGSKAAHLIDGSAFVKFLHWLDLNLKNPNLDEISVTQKLEEFRRATGLLEEIAFDTICGSGSNGAIVHYRVNKTSNKKIKNNNLLLIDSGGQYKMGTTHLTRTVAVGQPSWNMIDAFTRVLKGMIAISTLKWPSGLSGQHIDSLARSSLWSVGLDYDHGTGHGVGSYLSVHEGPHGISTKNTVPLEDGMIVSNEPGYYEPGAFGIRIENILLVQKGSQRVGSLKQMLAFETLTLAPIDKTLINQKILTNDEKAWLNNYHKLVQTKITPLVPLDAQVWLKKVCQPI
jgi:Xaa-Pro aminopeptidase